MEFCRWFPHIPKPSNMHMTAAEAPASAYLRAVPCPSSTLNVAVPQRNDGTVVVIVEMILSQLSSMWGIYLGMLCLM